MSERLLTEVQPFRIAGHRVEPASLKVTIGGEEARLEAKVMQVLVYLAEHAGRVVSRAELEEQLWPGRVITEDSVTKAIAKLRRIFGDDARRPRVIETLPKSGYKLIADVEALDEEDRKGAPARITARTHGRLMRGPTGAWLLGGLAVLLAALWALDREQTKSSPFAPPADKPAVAVVPFDNLGVAPDEDYFANGITADLITDLSKVKGMLVIARGSAFAYQSSGAEPRQISAELDVDYVVIGSVQRLSDSLRINVQIIEPRSERVIWGERYAGVSGDVFDIQDSIAASVVAALKVELAPAERAYLASRPTASVAAYDHYLRGLEQHGSRSEEQNLSARREFEKAIDLDPAFARAYTGVALTYSREAIDGWTLAPANSLMLAADYAEKATRMDPGLPQAHFVTGQVALFQGRHAEAVAASERAVEADPNYADAYALLAWTLNYAGRPDKAQSALDRAMRLNPRPPASYLEILGEIRFTQSKFEESASTFQEVLNVNPGYVRARLWNAAALARARAEDAAEWEIGELLIVSPNLSLARLELAFPFKNPRQLDAILSALKEAGLPEQ